MWINSKNWTLRIVIGANDGGFQYKLSNENVLAVSFESSKKDYAGHVFMIPIERCVNI